MFPLLIALALAAGCAQRAGTAADAAPPTVPNGLAITAVSPSEVKVSWRPSQDDVGVTKYKVYRNGAHLKNTDKTTVTDKGLKAKTRYCYRVTACDASGKESAKSADVCAVL